MSKNIAILYDVEKEKNLNPQKTHMVFYNLFSINFLSVLSDHITVHSRKATYCKTIKSFLNGFSP